MHLLTKSIKESLKKNDWFTALFISLALPGVCGSFSDTEESDQKKYSMWFDKYLGHEYKDLLHGEDCFILQQACLFRMVSVEKLIIAEKYRFVLPDKSLVKHKVYMGGSIAVGY